MQYLTRNKIYEKVEPSKIAKKIYIFCEGEKKEINYFKFFQGFSSNIDIIPIPNENSKSDPIKLKENADLLFNGNSTISPKYNLSIDYKDEVWFVIDTDRWNEGGKINNLREYCSTKNEAYQGWFLAQSNPSFEIWLFYHFFDTKPTNTDVSTFSTFKEFVNNKIQGGFDNRTMPIKIQEAVINSESNFETENGQPKVYSTEVFLLAKLIIEFTKEQLERCIVGLKK